MPVSFADDMTIERAGEDAVATVTVVVTDDLGTELGRRAISARVNAFLRADDPNRRGMQVDAPVRLQQLLNEEAEAAGKAVAEAAVPLARFATLAADLAKDEATIGTRVDAVVADTRARLEEPLPLIVKDFGDGLLDAKEVVARG